jgi:hypothetical protein
MGTKGGAIYATYVTPGMHLRSLEDVQELYEQVYKSEAFPQEVFDAGVENVKGICSRITPLEVDRSPKMPKFPNANEEIRRKAFAGLKKLHLDGKQNYVDRLEYELDNVIRAGFADYFLFLEDMIAWCRKNDVLVGPGRGCFKPETRVRMADGMFKSICDVKAGDMVMSGSGKEREVEQQFVYDVDEETIEIELEDGRTVECTLDHKFKVNREGEHVWVQAKDLLEDDELVELVDV